MKILTSCYGYVHHYVFLTSMKAKGEKMCTIKHIVMEKRTQMVYPRVTFKSFPGSPWKRDLLDPNTKQYAKCAPVRCMRHSKCPGPNGQPALAETGRNSLGSRDSL